MKIQNIIINSYTVTRVSFYILYKFYMKRVEHVCQTYMYVKHKYLKVTKIPNYLMNNLIPK